MTEQHHNPASAARIPWPSLPWLGRSLLFEVPIFVLGIALLYSVVMLARYWSGPLTPQVEIDLRARALPLYALYSTLRISIAYFLSLLFTLVYGYVAAYNRRAERFMVPLLDVLQGRGARRRLGRVPEPVPGPGRHGPAGRRHRDSQRHGDLCAGAAR